MCLHYSFSYKVKSLNCYPSIPAGEYEHAILHKHVITFRFNNRLYIFEIPKNQMFMDNNEHIIPRFNVDEHGYMSYLTKNLYQT